MQVREDGCEVEAGLGPIVALRLKLTDAQKEIKHLREVVHGQAYEIENRIQEFGILSAEIAKLRAELDRQSRGE